MPVSDVNGVELYWEQAGSGPRLLFCNGSGVTLEGVRPLLGFLAAKFDLLTCDYGGFGCPTLVAYGNYDGIAPAQNSAAIASRIQAAELHGYEGGHGFLFQDPAACCAC